MGHWVTDGSLQFPSLSFYISSFTITHAHTRRERERERARESARERRTRTHAHHVLYKRTNFMLILTLPKLDDGELGMIGKVKANLHFLCR